MSAPPLATTQSASPTSNDAACEGAARSPSPFSGQRLSLGRGGTGLARHVAAAVPPLQAIGLQI